MTTYGWSWHGRSYHHVAAAGEYGWLAACGAWVDRTDRDTPGRVPRWLQPCEACHVHRGIDYRRELAAVAAMAWR